MHEHDQEIIMALAEGTLDEAAATAAQAAISVCAECSADLELQRFALDALNDAPDIYLTATESARLHAALKSELVGSKPPPIRAKQPFVWGRWLPIAGLAAVFLAAVVSLPNLVGGSDDDAADATVGAPALESSQTRAASETTAAATSDDMAYDGTLGAGEFAEDSTASIEAAPATTESPATTTTAAGATTTSAPRGLIDVLPYLGSLDELDRDVLIEALTEDRVAAMRLSDAAQGFDPAFATCVLANTSPEVAPGLGLPADSEPIVLGIVSTPIGEELVLVAYVPNDVNESVFVTHQVYFCELVEVLP